MAGRRLCYFGLLLGAVLFFLLYGQWLSAVVLIVLVVLPGLSLLLSVPALARIRIEPSGPERLEMGQEGKLWLLGSCDLPMPPFRGWLRLRRCLTGESWRYQENKGLLTDHCGGIRITAEKLKIFDYLGLFAFRARHPAEITVIVRPTPIPVPLQEDLQRYLARAWRPKPGGGFSEQHELRLYRPGDPMNQIHWKLSAKTGKRIVREAMEPERGLLLLTLNLRGTDEELDRKFGRLLWMGGHLLGQGLGFEIRALTGNGLLTFPVAGEEALWKAVDTLLCSSPTAEGDLRQQVTNAAWQYHVGGDAHEA